MELEKFNKVFNDFKANFIFEATQKKDDEDKYHYSYGKDNIEIRDIDYDDFINLIKKLKEDKELKVTSAKKDFYRIVKKTKEKDGWSIVNYIKNKYPESEQFELPEPYGTYVIYRWPECVPGSKKFHV